MTNVNSLSGNRAPIIENPNETKAKIIEFFKMNLILSFNMRSDFLKQINHYYSSPASPRPKSPNPYSSITSLRLESN